MRREENAYNKSVSQSKEPFSKALYPRDQCLGKMIAFPGLDKQNAVQQISLQHLRIHAHMHTNIGSYNAQCLALR